MYYIGIDLGGTNIAAGIVDENYKIVKKDKVPTGAKRPADEITKDMADLCAKLIADCNLTLDDIEYVGIAAPGTANRDKGEIEYANNLPYLHYPIAKKFKECLPVKWVHIENDANAAAKGEAIAGAAKGVGNSVMITLGTGVGGGIVIDGKVYSGHNYAGAEMGHIVIEVGGKPCSCGRNGCWEAYSSATGLINMTKEKMEADKSSKMWELADSLDKVDGRTAFNAMKQFGDASASEVVDTYIRYLADGLINVINIFQPQILTIGGGVCNEGDTLLKPLLKYAGCDENGFSLDKKTQIKIAELGNDAGIIGAAVLGL